MINPKLEKDNLLMSKVKNRVKKMNFQTQKVFSLDLVRIMSKKKKKTSKYLEMLLHGWIKNQQRAIKMEIGFPFITKQVGKIKKNKGQ